MIKMMACFCCTLFFTFNAFSNEQVKPNIATLVSVGETSLYIECFGKGAPSIIVNDGFGGTVKSGGWKDVISSVSKTNQICIYDRANLGKSSKSTNNYDVGTIVEHQYTLLNKVGIKPPYLMVGHSYGSYPIKLFNHRYPKDVAAILLVDPSLYGQFKSHINKWAPETDSYDDDTKKEMDAELARWQGPPTNLEKINNRTGSQLIADSDGFGDKPYVLLWARDAIWKPKDNAPEGWHPKVWKRIKRSYSVDLSGMQSLSTKTKITFATTSEHYVHVHEPEIVINEIKYLLAQLE
ncbi:alpha/beta hydrolase [Psychrosphaera haliotis]